jgi:hypothetical protein
MGVTAEQIQITENEFFSSTPEALAYKTDENLDRLYAYVVGAWGENSITNVACWEIAYKALKGKLKRVPGYVAPVSDEMRARVDNTPSYQVKELFRTDPEFKAAWEAIAEEEAAVRANPWLKMTAEKYRSYDPTWCARMYVDNEQFKAAVQTLIDRGEI